MRLCENGCTRSRRAAEWDLGAMSSDCGFNYLCAFASLREWMHAEPQSRGVGLGAVCSDCGFNYFCVFASLREWMHAEPQSRGVGFGCNVLRLELQLSLRLSASA